MSDYLFALRLFARVARKGSFSAAGRELHIPQSTASRTIANLEKEIGASLLVRTTRAVTLTEAGSDFLARIEPILAALDEAEHAARGTGELRGTLRIGLGTSLAVREIIPLLPSFLSAHPALHVDLRIDDHRQDLVMEGVDLALRFGALTDSSATARKIRVWPRILVASPDYVRRMGDPMVPADLPDHSIVIGPPATATAWSFNRDGTAASIHIEGRVVIGASEGAVAAAVAGLGIVRCPVAACRRELKNGELIRLLADWDAGSVELSALFPSGRAAKPAARAFADYLVGALEGH